MLICFHNWPYDWKEEGVYHLIIADDVIFTRFVKECIKCGKKQYLNGPWRFKSDGRKVYG